MKRYIHGAKNGIYIIDLNKTLSQLELAKAFLRDVVLRGEKILFVGTKKQAREIFHKAAEKASQPYVINRWLGGMLTNNETIRSSVSRMRDLKKMEEDGSLSRLPKKEVSSIKREIYKLEKNLNGISDMQKKPGALFVVDLKREHLALAEAKRLNIPVVALVDTNADPDTVDFPIPGNDDSLRSIGLICDIISSLVKTANDEYETKEAAAKEKREKAEAEEKEKANAAKEQRLKKEAAEKEKREKILKKIKEEKKKAMKKAEEVTKAPAEEVVEEKAEEVTEAPAEEKE